jgi:PTH1 family peptidyl-tRNA hydrolase
MGTPIELFVGQGNPGADYEATRHNAGFWFVDLLAQEHGVRFSSQKKLHGESAEINVGGQRIRLLKPMTYMNLSGQSVGAAVNYFKIPPEHVLVAYDELDLPPGRAQLRFDGSSAGHNGAGSVIEHIGPKFWRLRFGVGHPRSPSGTKERDPEQPGAGGRREVIDHVLKRAGGAEEQILRDKLREAAELLPMLLEHGAERVKNRLHTRKPENE